MVVFAGTPKACEAYLWASIGAGGSVKLKRPSGTEGLGGGGGDEAASMAGLLGQAHQELRPC